MSTLYLIPSAAPTMPPALNQVRISIDNSSERFGAKTTIADIAQHSFASHSSDALSIYRADAIVQRDWRDEIEAVEMEYLLGINVTFKDGSKLSVAAWADCCDGTGCRDCGVH